jgi:hypothetical protein
MPSDRSFNRTGDGLFLAYLSPFFAAWTIYVLLVYAHVRALGVKTIRSGRRRDGTAVPAQVRLLFLPLRSHCLRRLLQ